VLSQSAQSARNVRVHAPSYSDERPYTLRAMDGDCHSAQTVRKLRARLEAERQVRHKPTSYPCVHKFAQHRMMPAVPVAHVLRLTR
jgi:hypothetical protein